MQGTYGVDNIILDLDIVDVNAVDTVLCRPYYFRTCDCRPNAKRNCRPKSVELMDGSPPRVSCMYVGEGAEPDKYYCSFAARIIMIVVSECSFPPSRVVSLRSPCRAWPRFTRNSRWKWIGVLASPIHHPNLASEMSPPLYSQS